MAGNRPRQNEQNRPGKSPLFLLVLRQHNLRKMIRDHDRYYAGMCMVCSAIDN